MTAYDVFQIILAVACLGVAIYCHVLAARLRRLNNLETGLGGAIAVMTSEISRLEGAICAARAEALAATQTLQAEVDRAKEERAFWVLQQKFAEATQGGPDRPRMRVRRRKATHLAELAHETA